MSFQSGPVNSMRGAAFLAGVTDAIVVDIGGTTTDIGMEASPSLLSAVVCRPADYT
jgi:N-methylhydantoinase A/oxoprolinase/acetone carboxylase beta subunit